MSSTPLLILASNSPRRQELLKLSGFDFEVFVDEIDESFPSDLDVHAVAVYLAKKKNKYYRLLKPSSLILTADTTVVLDGQVINKPESPEHAKEMLKRLSAATHKVVSGVCISSPKKTVSFTAITDVTFAYISEEEILDYIQAYQPFDKAGSYGIQEWIGFTKVVGIKGSFYNVMGLPTQPVYEALKIEFNYLPKINLQTP